VQFLRERRLPRSERAVKPDDHQHKLSSTALCVCPATFHSRSIAECRASREATVPHIKRGRAAGSNPAGRGDAAGCAAGNR
jgi:hypothetical protein